jgi:protein PhnA
LRLGACPEAANGVLKGHNIPEEPRQLVSDETRDSNGAILADGDSVTLIKDLKVKGSGGVTLKRGTLVKKIRLTGDPDEIEANVDKVRGLVLRTEFVKKA